MLLSNTGKHIILYDGFCELCARSIRFVIKRDTKRLFSYIPIQSDEGKELLKRYNIEHVSDNTFVYIEDGVFYLKSTAALMVCIQIKSLKWLSIFLIIPVCFRDFVYRVVAKYRYKWFGKNEVCYLP